MLLRTRFPRRAACLHCEELESRTVPSTGGGFSDGGLVGQYDSRQRFNHAPGR
jgi:hypothetical protein